MADFVVEFSPRAVSLERGCLVSTYREGKSLEVGSSEIQSVLRDPEVIQEPPQSTEMTGVGKMFGVPEVIVKPPQIDLTSTWEMFGDGAKNILGAGARVV